MQIDRFLDSEIAQHRVVLDATLAAVREPFSRLFDACRVALAAGNKIMFCGNGGSAGDAQHLATELVVRYTRNRRALPALALTTDTSLLTAAANDLSFDEVFARQVEGLGRPGDVLIGISTSGKSPNVLRALEAAKTIGVVPAGLGGRDGGPMKAVADPYVIIPSDVTARIQEMHILIGHALCDALEREFAG